MFFTYTFFVETVCFPVVFTTPLHSPIFLPVIDIVRGIRAMHL